MHKSKIPKKLGDIDILGESLVEHGSMGAWET
jgi:hypothetical protein